MTQQMHGDIDEIKGVAKGETPPKKKRKRKPKSSGKIKR